MTYTTISGDMWDSIAYKTLGSVKYTDRLMRKNLKYIHYFIFPSGIELTLPEEENTIDFGLPPWKRSVSE